MRKNKIIFIALFIFCLISLSGCGGKYPRPTKEYYINDFADALLPGSRLNIELESERMYEITKDEEIGGTQIVVATFLVQSEEEVDTYDKTDLYRQWQIGEKDMGLLILMIFCEETEGETQEIVKVLVSTQIEIGYRMEQFVSAMRAAQVIDDCLYNPEWEGSLDMGLGEMYFELLKTVYVNAYGYSNFNYDMEEYRQMLIETEERQTQIPMGFILYLFSPYASGETKIFAVIGLVVIGLFGGGIFRIGRRGGGGSSGGYGTRR